MKLSWHTEKAPRSRHRPGSHSNSNSYEHTQVPRPMWRRKRNHATGIQKQRLPCACSNQPQSKPRGADYAKLHGAADTRGMWFESAGSLAHSSLLRTAMAACIAVLTWRMIAHVTVCIDRQRIGTGGPPRLWQSMHTRAAWAELAWFRQGILRTVSTRTCHYQRER